MARHGGRAAEGAGCALEWPRGRVPRLGAGASVAAEESPVPTPLRAGAAFHGRRRGGLCLCLRRPAGGVCSPPAAGSAAAPPRSRAALGSRRPRLGPGGCRAPPSRAIPSAFGPRFPPRAAAPQSRGDGSRLVRGSPGLCAPPVGLLSAREARPRRKA
ncbi:zinc finger protein ZXDC-like [Lathamus discolor]|uniref:zinc finger protein ZXDC-like n=1 Tax=Lathamus discolor TaxID=678569 RepID=UPI0032B7CA4F